MLLGLLLLQLGWASDDGFEVIRTANDCVFEARAKAHSEGAALRATCHWADVDPKAMGQLVTTYADYTDWLWPLAECNVVETLPERTLVYQRQQIMTLADREVLLWMTKKQNGSYTRVDWLAANEKPLELSPGAIRTPKNTGFWMIDAHPDGGSSVKHEVAVNAGGAAIPEFLLNWLRYKGFVSIIKDVRKHASQKK